MKIAGNYTVLLEKKAEKDLDGLDKAIFKKVIPQIKNLAQYPRPHGCKKLQGSKNDWRIRVGDHRVLYEIDDKSLEIKIMRIRNRREVYR